MTKILVLTFMFSFHYSILAQKKIIDSLKTVIQKYESKNLKKDTNYVNLFIQLADLYHHISLDTALIFIEKGEKLAYQYNFKSQQADLLRVKGLAYRTKGNYEKANEYTEKSISIAEKNNFLKVLGGAYNLKGSINDMEGNYPKALDYYFKGLKIREQIKDTKGIGNTTSNIALLYFKQKKYDQSLEFNFKTLKIRQSIKDIQGIASSYNNIAINYHEKKDFDKALYYYQKSLKIKYEIKENYGIALGLMNIGKIHLENKDFLKADSCFTLSYSYAEKIGNPSLECEIMQGLARSELGEKDFEQALNHAQNALRLAKKIKNKENIKNSLATIAECYEEMGDFKNALVYFKNYKEESDKLVNDENTKKSHELSAKYEYEKKELFLKAEQEKKLEQQRFYLFLLIGASFFFLIIILFVNHNRKKILKAKNIIALQKNELEQKKIELEQNKEEITAQRDMLASQKIELEQRQEQIEAQKNLLTEQNQLLVNQNDVLHTFRSQITASINASLTIQQAMLPNEKNILKVVKDFFVIYMPKDTVSGDFYWIEKIDNKIIIIIADCTGHGIAGAFMSLIGHTLLDKIVLEDNIFDPAQILTQMHKEIQIVLRQKQNHNNNGMDMCVAVLERQENGDTNVTFAGAKRPLYYINPQIHQNIQKLKGERQSIGGEHNLRESFNNQYITLSKNSNIYLCSDGFADQCNAERKRLGEENLLNFLAQNQSSSFIQQKKHLLKFLEKHQGDTEQRDDILFVGIKL